MRKNNHINLIKIFIIFFVIGMICILMSGCTKVISTNNEKIREDEYSENDKSKDYCKNLTGKWMISTFEDVDDENEMICQKMPCDNGKPEGVLRISCKDEILSANVLLMFASYPPPGKEISVPSEISIKNETLEISYEDTRKCSYLFSVHKKDDYLIGKYKKSDCDYQAEYETEEQFLNGTKGGVIIYKRN